jgi:hypothetical protein
MGTTGNAYALVFNNAADAMLPKPQAVRPQRSRLLFVEDRYEAQGYDTQNSLRWALASLNLI